MSFSPSQTSVAKQLSQYWVQDKGKTQRENAEVRSARVLSDLHNMNINFSLLVSGKRLL
jgi:hypothetical protein